MRRIRDPLATYHQETATVTATVQETVSSNYAPVHRRPPYTKDRQARRIMYYGIASNRTFRQHSKDHATSAMRSGCCLMAHAAPATSIIAAPAMLSATDEILYRVNSVPRHVAGNRNRRPGGPRSAGSRRRIHIRPARPRDD